MIFDILTINGYFLLQRFKSFVYCVEKNGDMLQTKVLHGKRINVVGHDFAISVICTRHNDVLKLVLLVNIN